MHILKTRKHCKKVLFVKKKYDLFKKYYIIVYFYIQNWIEKVSNYYN